MDSKRFVDQEDPVQLHEKGWKHRYYMSKFGVNIEKDPSFPRQVGTLFDKSPLLWLSADAAAVRTLFLLARVKVTDLGTGLVDMDAHAVKECFMLAACCLQ